MRFSHLFGKKRESVPGIGTVPAGFRQVKTTCGKCGKALQAVQGGILVGSGQGMEDYLMQRPLYCATCAQSFCPQCCFAAAKKKGIHHMICPICGADLD